MFKKIIISMCVVLTLMGCSDVEIQKKNIAGPESDLIFIKDNTNGPNSCCCYVIHKPTNVVYLEYSRGITVMLNPDGTPITADQLEIDIEK